MQRQENVREQGSRVTELQCHSNGCATAAPRRIRRLRGGRRAADPGPVTGRQGYGAGMHVRTMEQADLPAVLALSAELGYPAKPGELAERFAVLARSPADALLVAEREGEVLGYLQVQERWHLESGRGAELVALVVSSRARRSGAGRALVAEACRWAKARGMGRMRVRSNVQRVESHRFYPALGFRAVKTQQVYELALEGEA